MKKQPTKWEEQSAKRSPNQGFIFRIYRKLKQLNRKKIWLKMSKLFEYTFLKRRYTISKHLKNAHYHLSAEECKSKPQWNHLIPFRMTITKLPKNNKCLWGCEVRRNLTPCWTECQLGQLLWLQWKG
jgi:hypothetical protein